MMERRHALSISARLSLLFKDCGTHSFFFGYHLRSLSQGEMRDDFYLPGRKRHRIIAQNTREHDPIPRLQIFFLTLSGKPVRGRSDKFHIGLLLEDASLCM